MGITRTQLVTLKAKVKAEMKRRNGLGPASGATWTPPKAYGSLADYGGTAYDFTHAPAKDGKIYPEYGQKTINLLLKIGPHGDLAPAEDGKPIPKSFNADLLTYTDALAKEAFTGETEETIAARRAAGENVSSLKRETSSCNAACTGLCVGSCIGLCNGCSTTCTATCGTGCNGGLMVSAY